MLFSPFSQKSNLNVHITTVHKGKKPLNCDISGLTVTSKSEWNKHITAVHEGKKPFKCESCDYICAQNGTMKRHVASVQKEKSHSNVDLVTIAVLKKVP